MSWIGPAAKRALTYGPYLRQAWKHAGKPAQQLARQALVSQRARRTALQHADTVLEGSVLSVMHEGLTVWVVYSGDVPVAAYPSVTATLPQLVERADLSKRFTPTQARERSRARMLRERAQSMRPHRRRAGEVTSRADDEDR
ncbi:MAG: hypothetical protein ACRDOY_12625 [Nocardioidaceae bacterium]